MFITFYDILDVRGIGLSYQIAALEDLHESQ